MIYYEMCLICFKRKTMFRYSQMTGKSISLEGVKQMQELIANLTKDQLRTDHPDFRPGDTIKVHAKVVEGSRERIQIFEGVVVKTQNGGINKTFTVRKISYGVGVERTFPLHSPRIEKIEISRRGRVRRAKLNYLRQRRGRAARIQEKI